MRRIILTLAIAVCAIAMLPAAAASAETHYIGEFCIGADIGKRAVDAHGTPIVCDNYEWVVDRGQTPRHPWADDQN